MQKHIRMLIVSGEERQKQYKLIVDEKGRIMIPLDLCQKYDLVSGDEIEIVEPEGKLQIFMLKKHMKHLNAHISWKKNAFFKTGKITFENYRIERMSGNIN